MDDSFIWPKQSRRGKCSLHGTRVLNSPPDRMKLIPSGHEHSPVMKTAGFAYAETQ
jgi:hypothetical protein